MSTWKPILLATAIAVSATALMTPAFAAGGNPFLPGKGGAKYQGTSKEQAACRPDVRRYCSAIKPGSDSGIFLNCLQANRSKLSKACLGVLQAHGV